MKIIRWIVLFVLGLAGGSLLALNAAPALISRISPEYASILKSGDARQLRKALDRGMPVNARNDRRDTPLMLAAVYGNASSVRLLLERGAEVNATNAAGASALMRAAHDEEKVRLLLKHGAEVNARSALGNTALILAARPANSLRVVELLLSHGADATATNNWGATALMAAVAGGDVKSARLLLKRGANVSAGLLPGPDGFVMGGGRTALMWAAHRGDAGMIKLLIEAGADVNQPDGLGTALSQAVWSGRGAAVERLLASGASVNQMGPVDGYTALHWAASSEDRDDAIVKVLLKHGADPNLGGGENVNAFLGTLQTPLMLARRRGNTPIAAALLNAGATNATPDRVLTRTPPARQLPDQLDAATLLAAVSQAIQPLQTTSVESKQAFQRHSSKQDCTSCHQQSLPMAAIGLARNQGAPVDTAMERALAEMAARGEFTDREADWQALFHPEAAHTKGYALFGYALAGRPADEYTDMSVHHLSIAQAKDGRWINNLPRPPIQTGDIGATALAVHALQRYPLPGRKAELAKQVDRARDWLWKHKPENTEGRTYQILGLAWAGEPPAKLRLLARALIAEQRADGGWAQLPSLSSDAYATGQAVYALRAGAGISTSHPAIEGGRRFLLETQLDDGTWHVRRRAFPFQPTMKSGFPHGRDSWISAAATSWAVLALTDNARSVAMK